MANTDIILVTRPEREAQNFAGALAAAGLDTRIEPMLEIVRLDFAPPDLAGFQGLIFTSANAVRYFCEKVKPPGTIKVYAVGPQTESAARSRGFQEISGAGSTAADLTALIVREARDPAKPFLHSHGRHVSFPVARVLAAHGFTVQGLVVYEARKVGELSAACRNGIKSGEITAVTFFSRRTAENFLALVHRHKLESHLKHMSALCISKAVRECVQPFLWGKTYAAERPDRQGMLDLVRSAMNPP